MSAQIDFLKRCKELGLHNGKLSNWLDEIEALRAENEALKQQVEQGKRDAVPEGWKLLKDSTQEERSWPEDFVYENGNYFNTCCRCDRTFMGHKRRPTCKVCFAAAPKQEDAEDHLHQGFYQSNIKQEK